MEKDRSFNLMIHQKKFFSFLTILSISAFGLISCTPAFKTTSELCVANSPVTLVRTKTTDNSEFKVLANRTSNDYKLYLEDALNSFNNIQSKASDNTTSPLTADEQAAVDFLLTKANERMGYVIENGTVVYASNPLDYMESLLAATDPDEVIQAFSDAKQNIAAAIKDDQSVCNYSNSGIFFIIEDPTASPSTIVETARAQLELYFNPFDKELPDDVRQDIIISFDESINELDINERRENNFAGSTRTTRDKFNATGVSPLDVRSLSINTDQSNQVFGYDDIFLDSKLGVFDITQYNRVCVLKDDEGKTIFDLNNRTIPVDCPEGSITREPQHESCKGTLDTDIDDTKNIEVHHFDVVPGNELLTAVQRLRIEIDYLNNEIRYYASTFKEAILRAEPSNPDNPNPDTDIIFNPTECEKAAVKREMIALLPIAEQASSTLEPVEFIDIYYDTTFERDENGEFRLDGNGEAIVKLEPVPIFTFEGTEIPERK